jgi:hypothetical protein
MKKIVLILITGTLSFAVLAQNETKHTHTKQTTKQRTESKSKAKSEQVSVLDGKAFKITLTQKDENMSATSSATERDESVAVQDRTDVNNQNKTNKNANPANTSQTKEPVENPDLNLTQSSAIAHDWNNTKAKLVFDNGMLKLAMNGKDIAMDNCKYTVTSGTADLATFSAGCKMNETAMGGAPVKSSSDNSIRSNETQDANPSSKDGSAHPDDRMGTTGNQQPSMSNADKADAGRTAQAQNDSAIRQGQDQSKNITTASANSASLNITGFVNGNSINGSIVLYENGKMTSYSFSGTSTGKRDTETLGLK